MIIVGNVFGRWTSTTKRHAQKAKQAKQPQTSHAPQVLDTQSLRLVGGGTSSVDTPRNGW